MVTSVMHKSLTIQIKNDDREQYIDLNIHVYNDEFEKMFIL